jgi:DNA-binding response OmpR family regulator
MQQQQTILVIDDDYIELGIMNNVLSAAGFRALVAEDGITGYHRAIFALPDLILLDVNMPIMDGFETYKLLRKNQRTAHIPIIFKTCQSDDQTFLSGLRAGVDDYIVKPCNHEQLISRITSRLNVSCLYSMNLLQELPSPAQYAP